MSPSMATWFENSKEESFSFNESMITKTVTATKMKIAIG
jgi:hypothetical protein